MDNFSQSFLLPTEGRGDPTVCGEPWFSELTEPHWLSVHMRFGTVSTAELFRFKGTSVRNGPNELIWREFYMQIPLAFSKRSERCIQTAIRFFKWKWWERILINGVKEKQDIQSWDAGMRGIERNRIHVHNRVRMITAMFHKIFTDRLALGRSLFCSKTFRFLKLSGNNGIGTRRTGVDAALFQSV